MASLLLEYNWNATPRHPKPVGLEPLTKRLILPPAQDDHCPGEPTDRCGRELGGSPFYQPQRTLPDNGPSHCHGIGEAPKSQLRTAKR